MASRIVTAWRNSENHELIPIKIEFYVYANQSNTDIIKEGRRLLAEKVPHQNADIWLSNMKFWQLGGCMWQLDEGLNEIVAKIDKTPLGWLKLQSAKA